MRGQNKKLETNYFPTQLRRISAFFLSVGVFFFFPFSLKADVLSRKEAVNIALKNNYDIQIAENKTHIEKNNSNILNSSLLPIISISGADSFSKTSGENVTADGMAINIDGELVTRSNAQISLEYTLFDGLSNVFTFKSLKEQHNISKLEAKNIIENTIVLVVFTYNSVANIKDRTESLKETLSISKDRFERIKIKHSFGSETSIQLSNAEVDYNNDSLSYLNALSDLQNAKRELNLLLGREINTQFDIVTDIDINETLSKEKLAESFHSANTDILISRSKIKISELTKKLAFSGWIPELLLNASYSYNESDLGNTSFFKETKSWGPYLGLTLRWNILNGKKVVQYKNVMRQHTIQEISQKKVEETMLKNFENAWEKYNNSIYAYKTGQKNYVINGKNFERSRQLFSTGQITSIEFRQAQTNLLLSTQNLNKAKYDAKNSELELLKLSSKIMLLPF